jgi:hypothetical protein
MPAVGKLVVLAILVALAGGAVAAYNAAVYEVLEPLPVAWTRDPLALELLELERTRRGVAGRIGASRRVAGLSGLATLDPADPAGDAAAELAALDRRIAALRAEIARRGGR